MSCSDTSSQQIPAHPGNTVTALREAPWSSEAEFSYHVGNVIPLELLSYWPLSVDYSMNFLMSLSTKILGSSDWRKRCALAEHEREPAFSRRLETLLLSFQRRRPHTCLGGCPSRFIKLEMRIPYPAKGPHSRFESAHREQES